MNTRISARTTSNGEEPPNLARNTDVRNRHTSAHRGWCIAHHRPPWLGHFIEVYVQPARPSAGYAASLRTGSAGQDFDDRPAI